MGSNSESLEEPKDRTRLIWLGVVALFAVAVALLWAFNRQDSNVTRARMKHILVKCNKDDPVDRARAFELITDLRRRIENGESFAQIAREYSDDAATASRGGDLGYMRRGAYVPEFEQYVWTAPIGQLSDIVQTQFGFHLIEVVDRYVSTTDAYELELERKATEDAKKNSTPPAPAPQQ